MVIDRIGGMGFVMISKGENDTTKPYTPTIGFNKVVRAQGIVDHYTVYGI